ncbi:MAG: RNA-binding S4 domain-containing protein [Tissierellia bacterium]|nr:RNA-binding S4 domain-containing protein [Tissierellia bacterium]
MKILINSEHIRLDQLLKLSGIVDSGGVAKHLIREGFVLLNGETCLERGKKIYPGFVVDINIPEENIKERIEVISEEI